jgi:hypothetical protein
MNSMRPLIVVRENSDVARISNAIKIAVSATSTQGLVLIEHPAAPRLGLNRLLNFRGSRGGDADIISQRELSLARDLEHFGLRFRFKVCRKLNRSQLLRHAHRFKSDLIIADRRKNPVGQMLSFVDGDSTLLAESDLPVWVCGRYFEPDGPVVAAVDPSPATQIAGDINRRVIRTAFSLAQKFTPHRRVQFLAICEDSSNLLSPSQPRNRVRAMNDLRAEIHRVRSSLTQWEKLGQKSGSGQASPCFSVRLSIEHGRPQVVSMTLDEMQPAVIVTGKPLRSAVSRFFRRGMLSTIAAGDYSVLTVAEQWLRPAPAEFVCRSDQSVSTVGRSSNVSNPETIC